MTTDTDVIDTLGFAALIPASAGACCTVGALHPGRAVDMVAAVVMVAAMADGVFAPPLLPGVLWFVVLALLAVAVAAAHRLQSGVKTHVGSEPSSSAAGTDLRPLEDRKNRSFHTRLGGLHAALGLLLMAAMALHAPSSTAMGMAGHHASSVSSLQLMTAALTLGYLTLTARIVHVALRRRAPLLPAVEALTMGAAVTIAAIAML